MGNNSMRAWRTDALKSQGNKVFVHVSPKTFQEEMQIKSETRN